MSEHTKTLRVILGNQLFPLEYQDFTENEVIFMAEDFGLCTYVKHHKAKIILFFCAMRAMRDKILSIGKTVIYYDFSNEFETSFLEKLKNTIHDQKIEKVTFFEIEDKPFEEDLIALLSQLNIAVEIKTSPMFLDNRPDFADFCENKDFILQATYYRRARKRLDLLVDNGKPVGGKWSFDEDNRKKLPKKMELPNIPKIVPPKDYDQIKDFVSSKFPDHPGEENLFFPYTHQQVLDWMQEFFEIRFENFGPYEDAVRPDEHFIFHSALSTSLNMGLITPDFVIDAAVEYAKKNNIPINSLEGFIRQVSGWREFIRGAYQNFSDRMISRNFWNHKRQMTSDWYNGSTGIDPLDNAILGAQKFGFTHHINRLMILASIMNMSRIHPDKIYQWFMEMFVDSSDWVMVPNVYGMGTFADGGVFSTKPYICGSSYILRMSNFSKGPWCQVVDGLYWKFIEDNLDFFKTNPRLSIMVNAHAKLDPERKEAIFSAANNFIETKTFS